MGLAGLDAALSGLRASQKQIDIISNNVSNVSTPGYSRKILPQSTQNVDGTTVGVTTGVFTRNVDLNLQSQVWTQISAVSGLDVKKSYLQRIEQFHGDPALEISVAAEIASLRDELSNLSDSPGDPAAQSQTVQQAVDVANKVNDFADLLTQLRNDAQDELRNSIDRVNQLLTQISEANKQIKSSINIDKPIAAIEDERDAAVKELAELIEVSTFTRGDGVMVVQTNEGVQLADERAEIVTFNPTPLSPNNYFPDSAAGIFIGDPDINETTAIQIADDSPGGKIGGLLELRDDILPRQTAQLDELAHKMALRFEAQGLRLFTNGAGIVPSDAAPDPTTLPNPTAVQYVGFAGQMQVNNAIINDNTLIQRGTYGAAIESGSNDVIRRVLEFGFSEINFEQAYNDDAATGVDIVNTGGDDLQTWLGLNSTNSLTGARDLTNFASVADLVASAGGALDNPNDQFDLIINEPRAGVTPGPITIDMSVASAAPGANAAQQLVNHINTQIAATLTPGEITALGNPTASVGPNGQIQINTSGFIEIDATSGGNAMGQAGLDFLGLTDNTGNPIAPQDPYIEVQVGNDPVQRITIEPGDNATALVNKLNAIDNLVARVDANGFLEVRPGDDTTFTNQSFGGDLTITGGPFTTNGATYAGPTGAGSTRVSVDNNVNIASALFGTYQITGGIVENRTPVETQQYQSQISVANTNDLVFREDLLGPGANISTRIDGARGLIDYAQKLVNQQSQELRSVENRLDDEDSLRTVLEDEFLNQSGVNLDEELGNLVVFQTAFAASARVVSAVEELFQELLNAV